MKKLFFFAVMLLFAATACESEVNNLDNNDTTESRVTEDVMEVLISDLLSGVCTPCGCEVKDGNEYIKTWEQGVIGSIGAKMGDFGLGGSVAFYKDGTCKLGYSMLANCQLAYTEGHPNTLYDTWQWSYDAATATITLIAEDLGEKYAVNTIKVISYTDGIMMIDGKWPNRCIAPYTYKYKCRIEGAEARREFESVFKYDEEDYPCCAK